MVLLQLADISFTRLAHNFGHSSFLHIASLAFDEPHAGRIVKVGDHWRRWESVVYRNTKNNNQWLYRWFISNHYTISIDFPLCRIANSNYVWYRYRTHIDGNNIFMFCVGCFLWRSLRNRSVFLLENFFIKSGALHALNGYSGNYFIVLSARKPAIAFNSH